MREAGNTLSTSEVVIVVLNSVLGAGILTLPRTISKAVGTPDVWISVIMSGLLVTAVGLMMVALCQRFPGKTVFEFLPQLTGRWGAYILGMLIVSYFLVLCSFEIRVMAEITSMYLLRDTPSWASIMVIMWIGLYMMNGGLKVMIRVFEIMLPITLALFLLVFLLSGRLFELNNLRPVLGEGFMAVLKGIKPSFLSYSGYEVVLITTAFMANARAGNRAVVYSVLVTTLIYLVTIVMVIGNLSLEGVLSRTWPTLDMVRSFEIEGFFFERFESFFLVFWLTQIFATYVFKHYFASIGLRELFRRKSMQVIQYVLLPVLYVLSYLPRNLDETLSLGDKLGDISIFLFGLLPLMLLILSFARKGAADYRNSRDAEKT